MSCCADPTFDLGPPDYPTQALTINRTHHIIAQPRIVVYIYVDVLVHVLQSRINVDRGV